MKKIVILGAMTAVALVGCTTESGDAWAPPSNDTSEKVEDEPEPIPAPAPAPIKDSPAIDREIFQIALELNMEMLTESDVRILCDGIDDYGMDVAIAAMKEGYGDDEPFYRDLVENAFYAKCN